MRTQTGYNYVGRLPCGCVMALCADYADRGTAKDVADFKAEGMTVERVSDTDLAEKIFKEESFFKCPHRAKQEKLF